MSQGVYGSEESSLKLTPGDDRRCSGKLHSKAEVALHAALISQLFPFE